MPPLDNILSEFGIKRKAISVVRTECRFCRRVFLDKWFKGELKHKVRCEHCGLINAEVDIDEYMKVVYQGFRHDMGTYGQLGNLPRGLKFRKMVKAAYDFQTDEEVEQKIKEYAFGVKIEQKRKEFVEKMKRKPTIRIKHKGEEEKIL